MAKLTSYVVTGVLLVSGALWLGSGTLVAGGNGPGNGEKPILALVDKNAQVAEAEHVAGEIDPHQTIAERVAQSSGASAPLQSVRTKTFDIQAYPIEVSLRGRTKASATVSVTPETSGVVTTVSVKKGQLVKPGDLLCTLDRGVREAQVAQAEASLSQAQLQYDTNLSLIQKGLAANNTQSQYESALKAAQAAVDSAKTELARTEIRAKVAGVVSDPLAEVGSALSAAVPCATIVQLDPMLFVANVPESQIQYARTGLGATIETVNGLKAEGKVSYIAAVADEATRSFPAEVQIPNADGKVLSGVTATATVTIGTLPAHLLPQSVLTLDDDGVLGIRAVEDGTVKFYKVTIVSDSREGVWVTGLPNKVDVITVGQEYVVAGQKVNATNEAETPASESNKAEATAS